MLETVVTQVLFVSRFVIPVGPVEANNTGDFSCKGCWQKDLMYLDVS